MPKTVLRAAANRLSASQRSRLRAVARERLSLKQRVRIAKLLVGQSKAASGIARAVSADASPARMWRQNLQYVIDLLDAKGVDYFCVPHAAAQRSAVAVEVGQRDALLAMLRANLTAPGMVIRTLDRSGRRVGSDRCEVIQVFQAVADPLARVLIGETAACEIELWSTVAQPGQSPLLAGPRAHRVGTVVSADTPMEYVSAERLSAFQHADGKRRYRTRAVYAEPGPTEVRFPIDAVYTWVDGDDPAWQQRKAQALAPAGTAEAQPDSFGRLATNASRYTSRDELLYSLRSVHAFAPWINHIYLVTDDQTPSWLDVTAPGITLVSHKEIFGDVGKLPTFNSHAIESRLHHIPGLSEHFLYFNDDMIIGRPVLPTQFFFANGLAKFFPSSSLVDVNPPAPTDAPVDVAAKNNRRLIMRRFGLHLYQKMRHVPYPLRRSVLNEIEGELTQEFHATAGHQFRDRDDLSIASSLAHYWAYCTGRSVPGGISHTYIDLGRVLAPFLLARVVRRRDIDVFCLNDNDSLETDVEQQSEMVRDFMDAYFPFKAPWELPDASLGITQRRNEHPVGAVHHQSELV